MTCNITFPGWLRAVALAAAVPCCANRTATAADPPAPAAKGRALLVGVTVYPNLGEAYQLHGPANDVLLMRQLLEEKFGFGSENILVLSEEEGKKDPNRLPTRANIEREFARLGKTAQPGEQIVIFMAGHGSQQPDLSDSKERKPDGMDEIFLPRDVGKWEDGKEAVANALLDHEVGRWLKPLQDAKASVWLVFDSCHSGTMMRGVGERARDVPADATDGLAVPKEAIEKAKKLSAQRNGGTATRGGPAAKPPPITLATPGGVAALYACQSTETTIERVPDDGGGKSYGLLTYTINKILRESSERPTYNELVQQVHREYVRLGRTNPTPLVEGGDRDREVLGEAVWAGRSRLVIRQSDAGLVVSGGALMGLTTNSVLAVYPPAGQGASDKVIGHVRVGKVRVQEADVEPCEYAGAPAPKADDLAGGRCEPVLVDYGDQKLPVAVDERDFAGKPVAEDRRRPPAEVVAEMAKSPTALVKAAASPAEAKWLVRLHAGRVYLLPASEWSLDDKDAAALARLDSAPADGATDWLRARVETVARAENLKRLAIELAQGARRGDGLSAQVGVEVRLQKDETDRQGKPAVWTTAGPPKIYGDDLPLVRLTNPGHVDVDVTVLYIDSQDHLDALFPHGDKGEDNRLKPGDTLDVALQVDGKTVGLENILVIAVKGEGPRADFGVLAQPTAAAAAKEQAHRGLDGDRGLKSPLGLLLQSAVYGEGTRSAGRRKSQDYVLQCLTWQVEAGNRPADGK